MREIETLEGLTIVFESFHLLRGDGSNLKDVVSRLDDLVLSTYRVALEVARSRQYKCHQFLIVGIS